MHTSFVSLIFTLCAPLTAAAACGAGGSIEIEERLYLNIRQLRAANKLDKYTSHEHREFREHVDSHLRIYTAIDMCVTKLHKIYSTTIRWRNKNA